MTPADLAALAIAFVAWGAIVLAVDHRNGGRPA